MSGAIRVPGRIRPAIRLQATLEAALRTLCLAFLLAGTPAFAASADEVVAVTSSGRHVFQIERASTPDERAKGLMGREAMAADHGMLFDFGSEQPVAFWMKNTPLSLDMVFIKADGIVSRIEKRATPFSEAIIPGGAPVRYVLEIIGGESDRIGLAPGDRIEIGG